MTRYAIGLGSNEGDRLAHLKSGLDGLRGISEGRSVSRLYETEPIGGPEQGPFLNAVVVIDSALDSNALLGRLREIEEAAGRTRDVRWGPRSLDLDIIASDGPSVARDDLVIPHPRATEREFVLRPLVDVWPQAQLDGPLSAREALTEVAGQGVELLATHWADGLSVMPGRVLVGIQFAWFLAVGVALAIDGSLPDGDVSFTRILGGAMTVFGAGIAFFSLRRLGPAMTAVPEPKAGAAFVDTGMYRLVRHPIYGGVVLWLLGTSLVLDSIIGSSLSVGLVGFFFFKSGYEERRLRIAYPEYRGYRERVRARLIPFVF